MELKMPNPRSLGLKSPSRALSSAVVASPYDICTPSSLSLIHDLKSSFVIEQPSVNLSTVESKRHNYSNQQSLQNSTHISTRECISPTPAIAAKPSEVKNDQQVYLEKQDKKMQELLQEVKSLRNQLARVRALQSAEKSIQREEVSSTNAKSQKEIKVDEAHTLKKRVKELENENQALRTENDILKAEKQALQKLLKATREQQQQQQPPKRQERADSLPKKFRPLERPQSSPPGLAPASDIPSVNPVVIARKSSPVVAPTAFTREQKAAIKDISPSNSEPAKKAVHTGPFTNVQSRVYKAPTPKQPMAQSAQAVRIPVQKSSQKSPRQVTASSATSANAKKSIKRSSAPTEPNCRVYVAREYYIDPATGEHIPAADFESVAHQFHPPPELLNEFQGGSMAYGDKQQRDQGISNSAAPGRAKSPTANMQKPPKNQGPTISALTIKPSATSNASAKVSALKGSSETF